jgi:hypothetical protein
MLLDEIKGIKDSGSYICANELWYWGGGPCFKTGNRPFKERLEELVGLGREAGQCDATEKYLRSSEAYDAVYRTLYSALPSCRNCTCWYAGLGMERLATDFVC